MTPPTMRGERDDPQIGRHRQQQVIQPEAEHRAEQDGPAAEAIGQRADHRAEEELHQRVERDEPAVDRGGGADVAAVQLAHQPRHDRQHDADAEHVDEQREEEDGELEVHRPAAIRRRRGSGDPPRHGLRR
ncbi:MAG: hypothetical protein WDM84_07480 [Bauldia sp.]